ncbi:hypothetical protein [Enterobacter sp.]|uniref:hypothetical protein n=1 Tax=Enterobacter sp. TaxID=42895 RepID=UPI00290059F2|nr:hypothetical protein [Enterobacter sp.]MDU1919289.1 hypothetical protein [Enterobacter sp.]
MVKIVIDPSCINQGGSTYDDTEVLNRIKALEGKTDNFVSEVTVSREGDKVKLKYTRVDGTSSEVEFDDKDTISMAYDDSALRARIEALEAKPDKDTVYDDTEVKNRLTALEAKEDSDKQTLTLTGNELSISNGNSVTLPVGVGKEFVVTSDTEGVVVTKAETDSTTTYNVNLDDALNKFYKKAETYTKKEVDNLLTTQENKATDLTVYKGTFTDKTKVKEGDFEGPNTPRITLTYSSSTGVGILKIDMKVMSPVAKSTIVANLPADAPVPVTLIESQVWVGNVDTSVWVDTGSRSLRMSYTANPDIFNKRIIINIPGIFKKV